MKNKNELEEKVSEKVIYDPEYDFYDLIESNPDEELSEMLNKALKRIKKLEKMCKEFPTLEKELAALYKAYNYIRDPEQKAAYDKLRENYKNNLDASRNSRVKVTDVEESAKSNKASRTGIYILGSVAITVLIGAIIFAAYTFGRKTEQSRTVEANIEDEFHTKQFNDLKIKQKFNIVEEVEEVEEVYDVNYFDDAYDDEKIHARAVAICNALVASNVMDISIEEVENQLRFINGSYYASTDMEAYDMALNVFETFGEYGTAVKQATNFAGGVVSENGVNQAIYLDAFLLDNCEHSEFMHRNAILLANVLTADTEETKRNASIQYLKEQADLMMGVLVDSTGTQLNYFDLDDNEGFIYGIMSHIAAPVIKSALGQDYIIPYEDNNGEKVTVGIDEIFFYYNPQCNGDDTENIWANYYHNLIIISTINKDQNDTLTLSSNNVESNE